MAEDRDEKPGSFLAEHPVICVLIGFALIGVSEAGCSISKYYEALTNQLQHQSAASNTAE